MFVSRSSLSRVVLVVIHLHAEMSRAVRFTLTSGQLRQENSLRSQDSSQKRPPKCPRSGELLRILQRLLIDNKRIPDTLPAILNRPSIRRNHKFTTHRQKDIRLPSELWRSKTHKNGTYGVEEFGKSEPLLGSEPGLKESGQARLVFLSLVRTRARSVRPTLSTKTTQVEIISSFQTVSLGFGKGPSTTLQSQNIASHRGRNGFSPYKNGSCSNTQLFSRAKLSQSLGVIS